jgi:hypothetical protein
MTSTQGQSTARGGREPFVLDRGQCLAFLPSVRIGRVILHGATPGPAAVLPVNFVLDGDQIVIRTGEGTILAAARSGAYVTFQADAIEETDGGRGWSVTVAGPAHEATGTVRHWLEGLPLAPIAGGTREHFVLIAAESIEGRWVGTPATHDRDR